jgi:hypothetical protein
LTIFDTFLTIFDDFWSFWSFLVIFGHFWSFFGHFGHFWSLFGHFLTPFLTVFRWILHFFGLFWRHRPGGSTLDWQCLRQGVIFGHFGGSNSDKFPFFQAFLVTFCRFGQLLLAYLTFFGVFGPKGGT